MPTYATELLTQKRIQILFILLTVTTTMFYAVVTEHIWEDFFITFKFSKNLVDGNGLVHYPGEYVYGFTSVINTLLPAVFYWISGKSLDITIWLFRIVSIAGLTVGGFYFLREILKQNASNLFVPLFFVLLFAFEIKTVMFTTNGQEAGFMMLFLLPSVVIAFNGYKNNWILAGLCWTGLIYTRPDAPVYMFLLVLAAIVFGQSRSKEELIAIFKAGLICGVLYLPWFIGMWLYYGSPIPNTITAKAGMGINFNGDWVLFLQTALSYLPKIGPSILSPTYHHFGGWPDWIKAYTFIIWLVCFLYWLIPSRDRLGRFVSFLFALLNLYFVILQVRAAVYPWYFPPAAVFSTFILVSAVSNFSLKLKSKRVLMYSIGFVMLFASSSIFFMTVNQIHAQQIIIENNTRTKIGLWLKEHKEDNDTVFLEPLGYIGYFSEAKMRDWPGLVSPEVINVEESKRPQHFYNIIKKLEPNWLVLRPGAQINLIKYEWFNKHYKAEMLFDSRKLIKQLDWIAGVNYLYFDSVFTIYKNINDTKGTDFDKLQ